MHRQRPPFILAVLAVSLACSFPFAVTSGTVTTDATQPPASASTPEPVPASPEFTLPPPTVAAAGRDREESILILEPGPGSRVNSPVRVAGIADPVFEQTLGVRIVLDDGSQVAIAPAQIAADVGERGPYEADIPFAIAGERQAFIQVFDTSARDGGTIHLASVGVIITAGGPTNVIPSEPHAENIFIDQPGLGSTVNGGVVHVEGFGLAGFEQTLLVEVLDEAGSVIGSQPLTVAAPDLGQPGPFSADIPYVVAAPGPGRIVVRDVSPAFGGDAHLSSVEVTLEP